MSQEAIETPNLLAVHSRNGNTVVEILGSDIPPEIRDPLYAVADQLAGTDGSKQVILNLKHVHSINSIAIGLLINFQRKVRESGGSLRLCNVDPAVLRLFSLTKMDQLLTIDKDEQASADAFRHPVSAAGTSWLSRVFGAK